VNGPHDLGGRQGFGPVVTPGSADAIHEDWELRCFVLNMMASYGGFGQGPFRTVMERMPPAEYLAMSYYEKWLHALETRLVDNGTLSDGDLIRWREWLAAGEQMPVRIDPLLAEELPAKLRTVHRHGVVSDSRFAPGDRVRVRRAHPTGHTRCPDYVRARLGVVERMWGTARLPDVDGAATEPYYAVRFDGAELWGDDAEPNSSVVVDLWESYLEAA
jgi:nitrile hydratase subunit beta